MEVEGGGEPMVKRESIDPVAVKEEDENARAGEAAPPGP